MNYKSKQIIIGGSIAGISCALELERLGIPTEVYDKQYKPQKLCGGLLTYKAYEELKKICNVASIGGAFENMIDSVDIVCGNKVWKDIRPRNLMHIVDRNAMVDLMIKADYENFGKETDKIIHKEVKGYNDFTNKKFVIKEEEHTEHFLERPIIFANGIDHSEDKKCFCLQVDIRYGVENKLGKAIIEFGVVRNGYMWQFPLRNGVRVGMGCDYEKGVDYLDIFIKYLNDCGFDGEGLKEEGLIKGAFLPDGYCGKQGDKIGDANKMVNCLTGEGIYYACRSGILKAREIYYSDEVNNLTREELEEHYTDQEKHLASVEYEQKKLIKAQHRSYKLKKFFYSSIGQFMFKHLCSKWLCEKVVNLINEKW